MARDIARLCNPLSPSGKWLEAIDPRLGAMGDLVEQEKIEAAADVADEVLAEGYLDIRPISVLLYAAFLEAGLETLPAIVTAIDLAIRENLPAIGPKDKKKPVFDKRIGWLFDRIADQIEYHDKAKSDQWVAWSAGVEHERLEVAAATSAILTTALANEEYNAGTRAAGRLASWLRDRVEQTTATSERTSHDVKLPDPPSPPAKATRVPDGAETGRVTLAVSHRFVELCEKLRAFEALIAKNRHDKAALVAADLQHLIGTFDPRAYFPELFADFAALYSKNIDTLSMHMENRESPAWAAMDQFYRVDLDAFVER